MVIRANEPNCADHQNQDYSQHDRIFSNVFGLVVPPDGLAISARARDSGIKAFDFTSYKETSSLFRAENLGDWRHGEMNGRKDYNSIGSVFPFFFPQYGATTDTKIFL